MQIGMKNQLIQGCQSGCTVPYQLPGLGSMSGIGSMSGDILDDIGSEIKSGISRLTLPSLPTQVQILPWAVGGIFALLLYYRLTSR